MLANWISRHINVRCANFFSPKHDPNIVIFTLNTRPDKDKIAQHPQFPAKLDEYNLKLLPPPREADETTVFVRNLPDSLFLFWETDYPHTLGEACLEFNTNLREIHTDIDEIHLIQHRTPTSISPPKSMRVSFTTPEQAKAFLDCDTKINHTIIRKQSKTLNVHIAPKYCTVCRKHSHRKGDSACNKVLVCRTCLSTQHTDPQPTCKKICSTHGDVGHTTASDLCPINIEYVRQERAKLNNKPNLNQIDALTSQTPDHLKPLHRSILTTAHQVNQTYQRSQSFQAAIKKNLPTQQPQPHTLARPNPSHPSLAVIASAFFLASLEENVEPGTFQTYYSANLQANGLPEVKCVTPSLKLLHRIAHDASTIFTAASASHPAPPPAAAAAAAHPHLLNQLLKQFLNQLLKQFLNQLLNQLLNHPLNQLLSRFFSQTPNKLLIQLPLNQLLK